MRGFSTIFVLILISVCIIFGIFWFTQETHIENGDTITAVPFSHPHPDIAALQNDLTATVLPDYSSAF